MKIIEALKQIKELTEKSGDLRKKVAAHCAYMSVETPVYPDQKGQVRAWIQSHTDIVQEIGRLTVAISKTNLNTSVTIKLGDKQVTKTITEWVLRRRTAASLDQLAWASLTDRNLKEGHVPSSLGGMGGQPTLISIVRCYDPIERDKNAELYRTEPSIIDRTLEVVNATTDLME